MFDNSNIFGSFNVSGMVVFIDGKKNTNLYRKFKITNDKNVLENFFTEIEIENFSKMLLTISLGEIQPVL